MTRWFFDDVVATMVKGIGERLSFGHAAQDDPAKTAIAYAEFVARAMNLRELSEFTPDEFDD